MAIERTFGIVKPDAVAKNAIGGVIDLVEKAGLKIIALRLVRLGETQAKAFYAVHKERPFYASLVKFMTSGPVVVSVLEGEGAIARNRELMGDTNSAKAAPGTIRARFGADIERNAVHGSDGPDTAKVELAFFFAGQDLAS